MAPPQSEGVLTSRCAAVSTHLLKTGGSCSRDPHPAHVADIMCNIMAPLVCPPFSANPLCGAHRIRTCGGATAPKESVGATANGRKEATAPGREGWDRKARRPPGGRIARWHVGRRQQNRRAISYSETGSKAGSQATRAIARLRAGDGTGLHIFLFARATLRTLISDKCNCHSAYGMRAACCDSTD